MNLKIVCRFFAVAIVACMAYTFLRDAISGHISHVTAAAIEEPVIVIYGLEDEAKVAKIAQEIQEDDGSIQPLDEFLGRLICGKCNRQCSLLALFCNKGETKKELQTGYYYEAVDFISLEI